jgi:hypothetical protein
MADRQVTCVTKPDRYNTHEAIIALSGPNWWGTRQQVVDAIKAKTDTFFTFANGHRANIGWRKSPAGTEYVQTYADNDWTNNLLSLPECPRR